VQESAWNCSIQVAMDQEKQPFGDKRVRRALSLALDRDAGSKAHLSKVRDWTITPSHYLNNRLDTVWLAE
jgi:ABC-type oligopeptide transport system substrate-binding subunit